MPTRVIRLTHEDLENAAHLLAIAFVNDTLMQYLLPGDDPLFQKKTKHFCVFRAKFDSSSVGHC